MVHFSSRQWCGDRKVDVVFSLQVFIKYGIHDWWQNDMDIQNIIQKCDHKNTLQWFKNDYQHKFTHKELWHVGNWFQLILCI
jgi:hypothetical protein